MNTQRLGRVVWTGLAIVGFLGGSASAALAVPPTNDYFSGAATINLNALPFSTSVNMTEATQETYEPQYCIYSYQTIWYRITPTTTRWLEIAVQHSVYSGANATVFRDYGGGIQGLSYVACSYYSGVIDFAAQAGVTYYLQVQTPCCFVSGSMNVNVREIAAPQPVASFSYYPSNPSKFDVVQFQDNSYDPGQIGFASRVWDFGDGTTSSPSDSAYCCPLHQFADDGSYTVQLTVTTYDGRSASTSRVVTVSTHDVAITQFKTPQSASAGQTRPVSVGVRNNLRPETVRVELYKSAPGSYQSFRYIGYSDQFVPVRPSNRTTDFDFNYTFDREDAVLGKVTFKAVASILNASDAFPADNLVISMPTKVQGGGSLYSNPVPETPVTEGEVELSILAVTPNPARTNTDLSIRLALASQDVAQVQVFDLSGRLMAKRDLGLLGPGIHETRVAWDRSPAPGVYWVRLTQSGKSAIKKIGVF